MRRLGVGIALLLLLFVTAFGAFAGWQWVKGTEFDSGRWRAEQNTDCFGMRRWEMVDDLKHHYLRRGMTTREVERLLGKPFSVGDRPYEAGASGGAI